MLVIYSFVRDSMLTHPLYILPTVSKAFIVKLLSEYVMWFTVSKAVIVKYCSKSVVWLAVSKVFIVKFVLNLKLG